MARVIYKDQSPYALLRPIRLIDNSYMLPESVLAEPEFAWCRRILSEGRIIPASQLTIDQIARYDYRVVISGEQMALRLDSSADHPESYGSPMPRLFDMPNQNLYYFESHRNQDRPSADRKNGRRRVELEQRRDSGVYYVAGNTLWASWSTLITDQRAGFDGPNTSIIHQWHQHPSSAIAPPPFAVYLDSGNLVIGARSSAGGVAAYTGPAPASWVPTRFVVSATLGASGHLSVWLNGDQIINVDTPIGYYHEGLPYLAYVKSGIYMNNTHTVDALYHANIEFGLDDLSSRIGLPLPIFGDPAGWPRIRGPARKASPNRKSSRKAFVSSPQPRVFRTASPSLRASRDLYPH
ncbi:polysaccharide lyase [Mycolicibacterium komossense]|uniref:Heparin lyase I family protein n=1 Tax=Mycolicibacterium komossense TaxID=1779 RepID=A0ABT3C9A3_9MYCO|nr:polysaccharide lyase [Mycolicibacterium komossense]MCV7226047.1 heparin lyase I family protein [Mycolicibacterium komossense]